MAFPHGCALLPFNANNPYYIAPDGEVGQQAFAVIREAIRKEGMVAIGKVVFTSLTERSRLSEPHAVGPRYGTHGTSEILLRLLLTDRIRPADIHCARRVSAGLTGGLGGP
jgi:non-homologous end joining protein Ku